EAPRPDRNRILVPFLIGLVLVLVAALGGMWMLAGGTPVASLGSPTPTTVPVTFVPTSGVAPSEQLGTLYVNSTPSGATIRLGTRGEVGHTPMEVAMLPPGQWPVHLS